MSLPLYPGAGYELIEGHRCASTAASSSRSIFAAVGARRPTSRARVLEVRIQSPPALSQQTAVPEVARAGRRAAGAAMTDIEECTEPGRAQMDVDLIGPDIDTLYP